MRTRTTITGQDQQHAPQLVSFLWPHCEQDIRIGDDA